MNTAKAAAAASTPNVKGGIYLDSFDSRIIEYQYAIIKLEALIKHIKSLQIKIRANPTMIPLIHYIVIITGPLMNVNDILAKRLDNIGKLTSMGDQRRVAPSVNTNVLNFELDEQQEIIPVKYDEKSKELLVNLVAIYENALTIYQKKLQRSMIERDANRLPAANGKPIPIDFAFLKDILEPMELNSLPKLTIFSNELSSYQFKKIPIIIDSINKSVKLIKDYSGQLEGYKSKPNDTTLKKLPHWNYTIHRIFACFVKLSELYTILRKLGRELYIPVDEHLHNAKILHNNVKLETSLNEANEFFKHSKKNQNLIFTLAKCTRHGSNYHVKTATIIEFTNFLKQSILLINKISNVVLNLIKNWELAETKLIKIETEMKQREENSRLSSPTSPTPNINNFKKIEVLFNPEKEKLSQEYIAKQQRERQRLAMEDKISKENLEKQRNALEEEKSRKKFEDRERKLREDLIKERELTSPPISRQGSLKNKNSSNIITTRTRSNSNSSISSNSSSSSLNALGRSNSISSPNFTSPTNLSRSSSLQKRPASVYISSPAFDIRTQLRRQQAATTSPTVGASDNNNHNVNISSPSALNSNIIKGDHNGGGSGGGGTPPTGNRRRSQSLQSSLPSTQENNTLLATAASAAALKQERHSSLKSKSEINHQEFLQKKQQQQQNLQVPKNISRSRSPSPLRNKDELPNIDELSLADSPLKKKTISSSLKSAMVKPPQSPKSLTKNASPSSPSQSFTIPDLVHETNSESSDSTYDQINQDNGSLKSLETIKPGESSLKEGSKEGDNDDDNDNDKEQDKEQDKESLTFPKPIIKKVRFTGVPDEIEETKPKKKGWIHPPKILTNNKSSITSQSQSRSTGLGTAADALQQEGLIFHNLKRGELDVNTGNIIIPNTSNKRIMNTLAANTNNQHKLGKWRLGLNK